MWNSRGFVDILVGLLFSFVLYKYTHTYIFIHCGSMNFHKLMSLQHADEEMGHGQHPKSLLMFSSNHSLHGAYISFATSCILYKWNGVLYMSLCLASFDPQFVRFIYIVADSCKSFILIVQYKDLQLYHNVFIHSTVQEHFKNFQLQIIKNAVAVNTHVHVFL